MSNPFEAEHLIGHVKDSDHFEVPRGFTADGSGIITLPQPFLLDHPLHVRTGLQGIDNMIEPLDLRVTKFMVLEVVVAFLISVIFILIAQKISGGGRPRGRLWNLFEAMLLFIRDDVARPAIGHHDGDRFLPLLWTMFFFILACNLFGLLPWSGSATGALATTLVMALITFLTVVGAGMVKLGPVGFWLSQVPHMDLPLPIGIFLKPGIFVLEVIGLLIRHFILAVRLLANMLAGHLVLAVLVGFITASWSTAAAYGIVPASILGSVAMSLLELFVAFLQAYIFTFLSALFIGMAVHPH